MGMFQSRYQAASHFRELPVWHSNPSAHIVSISLSSGFSFQEVKPPGPQPRVARFNLVIERLLISGAIRQRRVGRVQPGFNLVIERLLISGIDGCNFKKASINVSISLSSGFSFQGKGGSAWCRAFSQFQSRYRAASHFRARLSLRRVYS